MENVKFCTKCINCLVLLCCPLFDPQMTGGTLPAGPVREKVSVRQSVAVLTATPAATVVLPPVSKPLDAVRVVGPEINHVINTIEILKIFTEI